jgi:hypothetical protein
VVLRGVLGAETRTETIKVKAGQAVLARRGEWVRYSTLEPDGAEYVAVCMPAFSPELVRRDESRKSPAPANRTGRRDKRNTDNRSASKKARHPDK